MNTRYQEPEEESWLEKEIILNYWQKWVTGIIIFVIVILVGTGIYSFYRYVEEQSFRWYSSLLETGKADIQKGEAGKALAVFLKEFPACPFGSYRTMVRLTMIEHHKSRHQFQKVKALYVDLIEDWKTDPFYRDVAKLNLIQFDLDHNMGSMQAHMKSVDEAIQANAGATPLASEIKAYLLYKQGAYKKSRDLFVQVAQRDDSDMGLRKRAQSMIRLLDIKLRTQS